MAMWGTGGAVLGREASKAYLISDNLPGVLLVNFTLVHTYDTDGVRVSIHTNLSEWRSRMDALHIVKMENDYSYILIDEISKVESVIAFYQICLSNLVMDRQICCIESDQDFS